MLNCTHLNIRYLFKVNLVLSHFYYCIGLHDTNNIIKHDETGEIIYPESTSFLQYVSDNTDHNIARLDNKGIHHALASIAIANGEFTSANPTR